MQPLLPLAVGWYGKLSDRGDFDGRGLPAPWLDLWDNWLQHSLAAASQLIGPRLLRERLLAMAPWQFLVTHPGQGEWSLVCGLVVASCDRVGRAYPFVLVEALPADDLGRLTTLTLLARARTLAAWLQPALAQSRAAIETGVREWLATPWPPRHGGGDAARGVLGAAGPRPLAWSGAPRSIWWRRLVGDEEQPAIEQPWPPHEALLLEWLAVSD